MEVIRIRPIYLEVLTSPACSYCPTAVRMVKEVADSLPDIIAVETSVATSEGYNKAISLGITGVPTILINNKVVFVGVPPSVNALKQVVLSAANA